MQEAEASNFDVRRKLEEQLQELQSKQQALQADVQAQVCAYAVQLPSHAVLGPQPHACSPELWYCAGMIRQKAGRMTSAVHYCLQGKALNAPAELDAVLRLCSAC